MPHRRLVEEEETYGVYHSLNHRERGFIANLRLRRPRAMATSPSPCQVAVDLEEHQSHLSVPSLEVQTGICLPFNYTDMYFCWQRIIPVWVVILLLTPGRQQVFSGIS